MKALLVSLTIGLVCPFVVSAQNPTTGKTTASQAEAKRDTILIESNAAFVSDPVLAKAMADGGMNFRVFGRQARDDVHYQELAERFAKADTTLTGSDFFTLYYGYPYRDEYNGGYSLDGWEELAEAKKYDEAYAAINSILEVAPATPNVLLNAIWIAREAGRPEEEIQKLEWRLSSLLWLIASFNNGDEKQPYIVVNVKDEYTFIYYFMGAKEILEQDLVQSNGTPCDVMTITPTETDHGTVSKVWFDVGFPSVMLGSPKHWAQQLSDETGN